MRLGWLLIVLLGSRALAGEALSPERLARLHLVQDAVVTEVPQAKVWWWVFTASYAALTVGQLAPVPFTTDRDLRIDLLVGGASAAVGVLLMVVDPLEVLGHAPRYAQLAGDEEGLAEAEALLRDDAANEAFCTSWVMHAGNVAFNLGVGLLLGLAWHHWDSGLINFVAGVAVGELMILTQPTGLTGLASAPPTLGLAPLLGSDRAGLSLVGTF